MSVDDVIDHFQAAWSSRERHAFLPVCAPDLHYEDPLTEEPLDGPEALGDHATRLWVGFPDARIQRTGERLTDGRFVAAPAKLLATHRGQIGELPPTGRFIVVQLVFYCELDADRERLGRVRTFFDLYDAARQLGILPRPGSLSERALLLIRGFGLRR